MRYEVLLEKPAEKFIMSLACSEKEHVIRAISKLPEEGDVWAMQGKKNKGIYRLRVGDYRVLYRVDQGKLIVCVIDAGSRGQIYRQYK